MIYIVLYFSFILIYMNVLLSIIYFFYNTYELLEVD